LVDVAPVFAQQKAVPDISIKFEKKVLNQEFRSEGVGIGDFNKDGFKDVAFGSQWVEGPDFEKVHAFREVKTFDPANYSNAFYLFPYDFNKDGWDDILLIDIPGKPAHIYENPCGKEGNWKAHEICDWVGNESPDFVDVVGDSRPELLFNTDGNLVYAAPNWDKPFEPWQIHNISSEKGAFFIYTHGVGIGDIDGDGRKDAIELMGWWQQPESLEGDPVWKFHKFHFTDGGAQMLIRDVNGDGLNDVITCWHPHLYGVVWWEQVRENGEINFKKHVLTGEKTEDSPYGVKFTQAHAFIGCDVDGDGLEDFITGKRWWAHRPPVDPECNEAAVLYWWRLVRNADGTADFIPYLIDNDSGVGTQIAVGDLNADGKPDIAISNKKGSFIFRSCKPKK